MKQQPFKHKVLSVLTVLATLLAPCLADAAGRDWSENDNYGSGRESSGFWNRGPDSRGRRMTTAEISQALYGTPNEPYDTPADNEPPEATQAG